MAAERTRRRHLAVLMAGGLMLLMAGCADVSTTHAGTARSSPASPSSTVGAAPLVGTEWQLISYRNPRDPAPVAVKTDSTLEFNGKGQFTAHACNYIGGAATIDRDTIRFSAISATDMACGGEPNTLERQVDATANGSVSWSISASTLTLTNPDGHVLTYCVRPSIYPDSNARTIVAGDRAGGQYRLAVDGPTKGNDHLYIVFEERTAPGEPWGSGGQASPGPTDCLADTVLGAGSLGRQTFLAAWATPDVAKVTTQTSKNSPETPLTFFDVPGSTLRIAGLWTATFRPSVSPVTFYDKHGNVIAAYPRGPC